jgi:hypothetical protein
MKLQIKTTVFCIALIFALSGCAHCGDLRDIEELGPPLLRLTSAVQGVAERPDVYGFKPGDSGDECLRLGLEDDTSLKLPFDGYVVKVHCADGNASVLICDSEGNQALLEDVGCTSRTVDYRDNNQSRACIFEIKVDEVCQ